jgi:hypothetical protein
MSDKSSSTIKPLVLSVRDGRKFLGNIGPNKFWDLVKRGELELIGSEHKRWVTVASCERYVERQLAIARAEGPSPGPRKLAGSAQ